MTSLPDLSTLSHAEKDTLILALFAQLAVPMRGSPHKTPASWRWRVGSMN
ncbi:MAG: hypothetical protein ACJ8AW_12805 [Rhodopila sp.]